MSTALDVSIGLAFMYALLALWVTTAQEMLATAFSWRAKDLYAAIQDMLAQGESSPLVKKLYDHPLIRNLVQKGFGKLPSYIPSKTFAIAFLDVLQGETSVSTAIGADKALAGAKDLVGKLDEKLHANLKKTLTLLIADAERYEQDVDKRAIKLSEGIEAWFNDRMARAAGWYKRKAQCWSIGLAILVSGLSNASSINVAWRLWTDGSMRAAVVSSAQQYHDGAAADLLHSHIPIGWSGGFWAAMGGDWCHALLTILGWLATAFAVSLGSGFWFDALGRLIQLRGAGPKISTVNGKQQTNDALT
jgi:hypothetical protein